MLSRTAQVLAARRAVATERGSPIVHDPYARLLVDEDVIAFAEAEAERVHYVLLRHRALEDFLLASVSPDHAAPCGQVVLLGAGLDTKYARLTQLQALPFFEVDQRDMLDYKRARLTQHGLPVARPIPIAVRSIDDLHAVLCTTSASVPTTVIAEGFFMYQSEQDAFDFLTTIARYYDTPPWIGFDFFAPELAELAEFIAIRQRVEAQGEVFKSFIPTDRVRDVLSQLGLRVDLADASDLHDRYMTGASPWTGMRGVITCCASGAG